VPKRGIGDRAVACISQFAERERVPFVAALGRPQDAPGIGDRLVAAIFGLTALLEALRTVHEGGRGGDLIEASRRADRLPAELRASQDPQDETGSITFPSWWPSAASFDEFGAAGHPGGLSSGSRWWLDADEIPDGSRCRVPGQRRW